MAGWIVRARLSLSNRGTLTISHCLVTANATTGSSSADPIIAAGGAVNNLGSLAIQSSTFSANSSTGPGGAIYSGSGSTLTITGSLFTGNLALSAWAGAIYCDSTSSVSIADSTFSFNQSGPGGGGAIGFWNTKAVVRGTTINNNTTSGGGGAMTSYAAPDATIGIENSTLSGNSATSGASSAGAIYAQRGTTDLRNVTITANAAPYGGGIQNPGRSTVLLRNTIIAGNVSQSSADCSGPVTSSGYNLIGSSEGCTGLVAADITGVPASLGPLGSNGGPTQTHVLYSGSLAIDGGNPSGCLGLAGTNLTVDQRGSIRPFGSRCDIGAVEMSSAALPPKRRTAHH